MPTTAEITRAYRRQTIVLRAQTLRDLLKLWPALDVRRLDATYPVWLTGVTALVQRDRARSSSLAGAYLRAFHATTGVGGEAVVLMAAAVSAEQLATVARVTSVVAMKRALIAGRSLDAARRAAFVLSSGDLSRLVLDAGRDTIRASTVADPRIAGWQRVGSGRTCDFCSMLIGRGEVYTEDTAGFETHGHCACSAEPVYR